MAVFLSPVFGVAGQLFDNNGNPLAGGKIYTYTAGTTTPAATYTSSLGSIAHSNPIVLDGAGRVPNGEIWLTDGITYKFVVEDSASNLIGTYDNLSGINSNFVAFTNEQEIQTATAGQTVFNLTTMQYQPGTNSLSVFVDGVNQYGPGAQYAYVETDSDTVTFVSGLHVGASVKFTTSQLNSSGAVDASQVTYDPPFTGSVATNVEDKLAQTVSVKDFGAVGDGITDDTTAIQNAIDSLPASKGGRIYFPQGIYAISSTIDISNMFSVSLYGDAGSANTFQGNTSVQWRWTGTAGSGPVLDMTGANACEVANISFYAINDAFDGTVINLDNGASNPSGNYIQGCVFLGDTALSAISEMIKLSTALVTTIERCFFRYGQYQIRSSGASVNTTRISDCWFQESTVAAIGLDDSSATTITSNVFETIDIGAIKANGLANGLAITNNWMGDTLASFSGTIIDLSAATGRGAFISGNTIQGNTLSTAISLNASTYDYRGITISNNKISGGTGIDGGYLCYATITNNDFYSNVPFTYTEMIQSVWANNNVDLTVSGSGANIGSNIGNNGTRPLTLANALGLTGQGIYTIICRNNSGANIGTVVVSLNGSAKNVTKLLESAGGIFTTTKDNAATINIYWDAGTETYRIQNKYGVDIQPIINAQSIL